MSYDIFVFVSDRVPISNIFYEARITNRKNVVGRFSNIFLYVHDLRKQWNRVLTRIQKDNNFETPVHALNAYVRRMERSGYSSHVY